MHAVLRLGPAELEVRRIEAGSPGGPWLVFLHEGLGSVSLWRDFPDRLAAATGLPALVYSRPGYGRSSPITAPRPLDYMEREAKAVLPALLRAAGIERFLLVGHSDGASIAAVFAGALCDPGLVGLVLMAPHFFTEAQGLSAIAAARKDFLGDGMENGLAAKLQRHHPETLEGAFWGWNRAWLDPGFRRWDLRPYLPAIAVPSLVIQGSEDRYGSLDQVDCLAALSGSRVARCILQGCGHSPHRDRPSACLDAASGFINGLLGDAAPAYSDGHDD